MSDTKLQIVEHGVGAKQQESSKSRGSVSDLVIPIIMLIVFCMAGMVYSGGFFDAANANYLNFVDAETKPDTAAAQLEIGEMMQTGAAVESMR